MNQSRPNLPGKLPIQRRFVVMNMRHHREGNIASLTDVHLSFRLNRIIAYRLTRPKAIKPDLYT